MKVWITALKGNMFKVEWNNRSIIAINEASLVYFLKKTGKLSKTKDIMDEVDRLGYGEYMSVICDIAS